jgi:YVTN family beta-propeller protein
VRGAPRLWVVSGLLVLVALVAAAPVAAELRAFITNERSNDVTVVEVSTARVLRTIPVGRRPRGIAGSPDGSRIYIANSDANSITVVNAASLAILDTLPAGIDPEGLAVGRDGSRLYVTNENDSALSIVDPVARRVARRVAVGTEPEMAVVSPDGRWVAVSNESSHDVYLIDAAGDVVTRIPVPENPRGMRFTRDSQRLYVASERAQSISLVDIARRAIVRRAPTGGTRPVDVMLSHDERRLYVSHGGSGDLRVLDAATFELVTAVPVGPRAWWMAMTPDGQYLWITVGRANEVVVVDTTSHAVSARIAAGLLPWGVTIVDVPRPRD